MVYKLPRVPTGVKELDKLIEGGFVENSVNLIVGGPGSGKTIFAIQFLMEGLKKGDPAMYITFEEKKEKLYNDMLEFNWDLEKYEKSGKFIFLEYTPEQVKQIITEGGGIVESIIQKSKIKRLVIDSITSFALLYEDELTKKEAALALFELLDKWECTSLLVSQDLKPDDSPVSGTLEFEVDSTIYVYHARKKGKRIRGLEIVKMRGTKIPEKIFPLKITEKGVSINPKGIVVL